MAETGQLVDDPDQQCKGGRLGGHREEATHLGRGTFERVRAPEVERDQRELEGQPDQDHHHAQDDRTDFGGCQRHGATLGRKQFAEPIGNQAEIPGSEHARDEADSIEHHAGGTSSVNNVFQGRFTTETLALEETDHHVAGHTGHFHRHEQHQQVVGRGHQHHANGGTDQQRVEVGTIFPVGNAAENRQRDHQDQEDQQEQPEEDGQAVVDQQTAKYLGFLPNEVGTGSPAVDNTEGDPEGNQRAGHRNPMARHLAVNAQQSSQQQGHDGAAQHQFREEQPHVVADLGRQARDQVVDGCEQHELVELG